jgi:pantoate--beta-alanine ligase
MGDLVVCRTVDEVRSLISNLKAEGNTISFVPTMGALHHGHIALVEQAAELGGYVVVSIFVNPKQFNNSTDLEKYPRPLEQDLERLSILENVIAFVPEVKDIYPDNFDDRDLDLGTLVKGQEAIFRPGHFEGVVNVVSRLFDIVQPDYALFGEKDYQQLAIIKFMTKSLNYNVEIIGVETIREDSGLASSSRNMRLSDVELEEATILFKALSYLKKEAFKSELDVALIAASGN